MLEEAAGQAESAGPGARDLFGSIKKFQKLPDYLQVWPSHGAGSACGKGLGAIPSSTVGYEKLFNEALQFDSEAAFVEYILQDQPVAPPYFAVMKHVNKHVNKHGPKLIADQGLPARLDATDLGNVIADHQVLDVRAAKEYAQEHVARTINIPAKYFARDGSWFIDYQKPLYLIVGTAMLDESLRVLREMGVDNVAGYFDADEVAGSGLATEFYEFASSEDVVAKIESGEALLVDVRSQAEWDAAHLPQATSLFLGDMMRDVAKLNQDKPIVFQCRTGARSAIACSIAQAAGVKNVINLDGGIVGWQRKGYPVVTDTPPRTRQPLLGGDAITTGAEFTQPAGAQVPK